MVSTKRFLAADPDGALCHALQIFKRGLATVHRGSTLQKTVSFGFVSGHHENLFIAKSKPASQLRRREPSKTASEALKLLEQTPSRWKLWARQ